MTIADYFCLRTPRARLAPASAQPDSISKKRILLSLAGLLLGVVASFFVTGLVPSGNPAASGTAVGATAAPPSSEPEVVVNFSKDRLLRVGLISLVIVMLSYPGIYFALKIYHNEPAFLLLFVSFQYGYFWQSVVDGARVLLKT